MCGPDQPFASTAQALAALRAALGYLASADATTLTVAEQAECLLALERAESARVAARSSVLAAFAAGQGYACDGHGTERSWLRWQARITNAAAGAAVAWSRRLAVHPAVHHALAAEEISPSWAREMCDWTDQLPESARRDADVILLTAAAAGAGLADLAGLAEEIRRRTAAPDKDDDDGSDGRSVRLDLHYRGAGRLRGDLTPRCAEALQAMLDALGKKQGAEDTRTRPQRYHDALEELCRRVIAGGLPDRAGQSTQIQLHTTIEDYLGRAATGSTSGGGEHGDDAAPKPAWPGPAARPGDMCDAQIVPIVTGYVDHDLLDRLAQLITTPGDELTTSPGHARDTSIAPVITGDVGYEASWPATAGQASARGRPDGTAGGARDSPARDSPARAGYEPGWPATTGQFAPPQSQAVARPGGRLGAAYARELTLRQAIALLSGPAGLASRLRATTLTGPAASISLPLDVGAATDTIPPHLRRAVILRDQHCSFPGCEQRPAGCQVHHIVPVSEGGPTSLENLLLACSFHHLIAVHEWGWRLILNADGTKTAISPDGSRVLHTHSPAGAA